VGGSCHCPTSKRLGRVRGLYKFDVVWKGGETVAERVRGIEFLSLVRPERKYMQQSSIRKVTMGMLEMTCWR
jgi:hypothetical protein